jgi:ethanolamine utilization protein EutA (predicted chaperonin)
MIGQRIIKKLEDSETINTIASKFFAVKIPQSLVNNNYQNNTIVYSVAGAEVSNSKQEFQGLLTLQVSIEILTKTYEQLQDLSRFVFNEFNKGSFSAGNGPVINSCVLSSMSEEDYNDQLEMFTINHTYSFRVVQINTP